MAKKSIKKETIEAKINKQVENIENDSNKIDISENIISIENIKDSINEVDVNIEHELDENIKALSEEMDEILAPVKDIADKISDIAKKGEELDSILSGSTPEEIQSYINALPPVRWVPVRRRFHGTGRCAAAVHRLGAARYR